MRRLLSFLCFSAFACLAQTPAYLTNPDFLKQRDEARRLEKSSRGMPFAAGAWNKANKIAGGACMECLEGAAAAHLRLGETKDVLAAAREMDAKAATPQDHTRAEILLARAVLTGTDRKKPNTALLQEAHTGLGKAEALSNAAYYYDGRVLAFLGRSADASAAFATYAHKTVKTDPMLLRARHFAARPELSTEDMAPAVLVTTSAGKHFNLDAMNGRVVLIDFWATWCGPCKQELPHIKKLAQQYADAPFELISISWDSDEGKWKDFIAANGMTWNQYRDADHSVTNAFGINSIPHYFTIDANGVLTAENIGQGANIDGRIKKLVAAAREAATPVAASSASPATPASAQQ